MLKKVIFVFSFFACFATAYAVENNDVSPEMKCIAKCVGKFGWDQVESCVDVCAP